MKIGIRKPSITKSISSRTSGSLTRSVKSSVSSSYGKKGTGYAKDPVRAVKNKVYKSTTRSIKDLTK